MKVAKTDLRRAVNVWIKEAKAEEKRLKDEHDKDVAEYEALSGWSKFWATDPCVDFYENTLREMRIHFEDKDIKTAMLLLNACELAPHAEPYIDIPLKYATKVKYYLEKSDDPNFQDA